MKVEVAVLGSPSLPALMVSVRKSTLNERETEGRGRWGGGGEGEGEGVEEKGGKADLNRLSKLKRSLFATFKFIYF